MRHKEKLLIWIVLFLATGCKMSGLLPDLIEQVPLVDSPKIIGLAPLTFSSCKEIQDESSGAAVSGEYEIDVDLDGPEVPINVYCEMDLNGGGWTRIFVHRVSGGLFANDSEALEINSSDIDADLYSILVHLNYFKRDSKFEFWLNYPEIDNANEGNHWTQTSNPTVDSISGYTAISVDHTSKFWGGLEKSGPSTFIDGSVTHGNWYYAIGSKSNWGGAGKIPGPSPAIGEVYLYVK